MEKISEYEGKSANPYLIMDFWHFSIISTLMAVFFPWSLLFCVVFYGLEDTKLLCLAMLHDGVKTILAVLSFFISLAVLIGIIIFVVSLFS